MTTLKLRIQEDMKAAMRAQEKQRLDTIRLIIAAIKQAEIDSRTEGSREEADDTRVMAVLEKMIKQRKDSIQQYQAANRKDLADQEAYEISVIQTYLPAQLSEAEIDALIAAAMQATGATSGKDMGKVIAELKPKLQGKADMGAVSAKVKAKLAG